jgi:hypothetical protein
VVFGVTDYWQYIEKHGNLEAGNIETRQGISLIEALAASSTLKHFIWSTLPSATPESPGKVEVPHFNAKHKVDIYLKEKHPELASKTTYLGVGWYTENMAWYPFFSPQRYVSIHAPILESTNSNESARATMGTTSLFSHVHLRQKSPWLAMSGKTLEYSSKL